MYIPLSFTAIILASVCSGCPLPSSPSTCALSKVPLSASGLRLEDMNLEVSPVQDFNGYANGNYEMSHPLEKDDIASDAFQVLDKQVLHELREILIDLSDNLGHHEPASVEAKLGRFWKSAMDEEAIEEAGVGPLESLVSEIDNIATFADFQRVLGQVHQHGVYAFFQYQIIPHPDDPSIEYLQFVPALGAYPNPVELLQPSKFNDKHQLYKQSIIQMFHLIGMEESEATTAADAIVEIETTLFFEVVQPSGYGVPFVWAEYYSSLNLDISQLNSIGFQSLAYFKYLSLEVSDETRLPEFKYYLKWMVLHTFEPYLSKAPRAIGFERAKAFFGHKTSSPRWQPIVEELKLQAPQMLGKVYCGVHFNVEIRQQVERMLLDLKAAFDDILHNVEWMSEVTRKHALEKLNNMRFKIGCPTTSSDFEHVDFPDSASFFSNVIELRLVTHAARMERVGKVIDPETWSQAPYGASAVYLRGRNELLLPAAMLQLPIYSPSFDVAVQYGTIGSIIGHELTHGFDASGQNFDAKGNLNPWWTPEDMETFNLKIKDRVIAQYSAKKINGHPVYGDRTLDENLADIGGVKIAYHALEVFYKANGPGKVIDGLSPYKRFFIAHAQLYAQNMREEMKVIMLTQDVHAPFSIRAAYPLAHLDNFYEAFDVQEGDTMYIPPEERVRMWG